MKTVHQRRMIQNSISRSLAVFLLTVTFCFWFQISARADSIYISGYFHYTVDKGAVTITEYFGTERDVSVPDMIAGNPVSTIAKNAFASNTNVKNISLPETVLTIAEGAFGTAQSITYRTGSQTQTSESTNVSDPAGDTATGESTTDAGSQSGQTPDQPDSRIPQNGQDTKESADSPVKDEPAVDSTESTDTKDTNTGAQNTNSNTNTNGGQNNSSVESNTSSKGKDDKNSSDKKTASSSAKFADLAGLTDQNGNFVTTDNNNHLIAVDKNGNETLLDDTKEYTAKKDKDGSTVITDSDGNPVQLNADGKLKFTDASGNQIDVDLASGNKLTQSSDGSFASEEIELDTFEETDEAKQTDDQKNAAEKNGPAAIAYILVGVLVACAAAFAVWQFRKKKKA